MVSKEKSYHVAVILLVAIFLTILGARTCE